MGRKNKKQNKPQQNQTQEPEAKTENTETTLPTQDDLNTQNEPANNTEIKQEEASQYAQTEPENQKEAKTE